MLGLAFAMAPPAGGAAGGSAGMFAQFQGMIPLVLMFAIFYFLLIPGQGPRPGAGYLYNHPRCQRPG